MPDLLYLLYIKKNQFLIHLSLTIHVIIKVRPFLLTRRRRSTTTPTPSCITTTIYIVLIDHVKVVVKLERRLTKNIATILCIAAITIYIVPVAKHAHTVQLLCNP